MVNEVSLLKICVSKKTKGLPLDLRISSFVAKYLEIKCVKLGPTN
jgi:hypothetical protein